MKKLLAVTLLLVGCSVNASAQEFTPYVGADVNYSDVSFDNGMTSEYAKDKYSSISMIVGTKVTEFFGVEAFYQISDERSQGVYGFNHKTSFEAYGVDAIVYQPILCGDANLLASFGVGQYLVDTNAPAYVTSDDSLGYRFGLGAEYMVTEDVAVRATIRHVILDDITFVDSMNEVSVGIRYAF